MQKHLSDEVVSHIQHYWSVLLQPGVLKTLERLEGIIWQDQPFDTFVIRVEIWQQVQGGDLFEKGCKLGRISSCILGIMFYDIHWKYSLNMWYKGMCRCAHLAFKNGLKSCMGRNLSTWLFAMLRKIVSGGRCWGRLVRARSEQTTFTLYLDKPSWLNLIVSSATSQSHSSGQVEEVFWNIEKLDFETL